MTAKTSIIQVNDRITIYIINNYKYFAKLNTIHHDMLYQDDIKRIQESIEDKLQTKILMVSFDKNLSVIEFYPITHQSPLQ